MPKLVEFQGIEIYMYLKDHNPPHVHAFYGDDEAVLGIAFGQVIDGALPPPKLGRAQAWVQTNKTFLEDKWSEFQ